MEYRRWSVHELAQYLRSSLEADYRLQDIEIEGEISNFRIPASGHAYFTLKDAGAQLACVIWASDMATQRYRPREGDRAIVRGAVSYYEKGGQLQLYGRSIQAAGQGDLYVRFEQLKQHLSTEGLFSPERKRPLPALPTRLAIVTSPGGAALRDVISTLQRRFPLMDAILIPTLVQGEAAPTQIVMALAQVATLPDRDLLLLVRGGGSLEDLWAFNDERVVRAVAACPVPVISGVGHEIDFTLADFAADLRAPTPTAAAEYATPQPLGVMQDQIDQKRARMSVALQWQIGKAQARLNRVRLQLRPQALRNDINRERQTLDMLRDRLQLALARDLGQGRKRLASLRRALINAGPEATLARGFALLQRADGTPVSDVEAIQTGEMLTARLHRGSLRLRVEERWQDE